MTVKRWSAPALCYCTGEDDGTPCVVGYLHLYHNPFCENCVLFDNSGAPTGKRVSGVTVAAYGWQDNTRFVGTSFGCERVAHFP